jgi:hypothetical protein
LPLYQKWSNDFNPVGSRIGYPGGANVNFQIRNDDTSSIEFWTNNNPQVYINEQPGATPFLGVGTNVPIGLGPIIFTAGPGPSGNPVHFASTGSGEFNGDMTIAGDYFSASDENLKSEFNSLSNYWEKILEIPTYSYAFKENEKYNFSKNRSFGFKAQEVKEVLPELVAFNGEFHLLNYIGFIPFLTEGLKEHQDRLKELELNNLVSGEIQEQMTGLKNENQELKSQNELLKQKLELLEQKFDAICQMPCFQGNNEKANSQQGEKSSENSVNINDRAELFQNEPNPFTSTTTICYYTPEGAMNSKILIRNTEGKIVDEYKVESPGHGSINILPGTLAPATYYYTLTVNGIEYETKKMILINN